MADMSDLSPIQQMTMLEHCPKEERRALHGLLLMRSSASYSPSVEEMERGRGRRRMWRRRRRRRLRGRRTSSGV